MTDEARVFIAEMRRLGKVKEFIEGQGILSVKLDGSKLSDLELDRAKFHIRCGSPEIEIIYNGVRVFFTHVFGCDASDIFVDNKAICESYGTTWTIENERQLLMGNLADAEKEENYLLCADIMKKAQEKGIDLKRH